MSQRSAYRAYLQRWLAANPVEAAVTDPTFIGYFSLNFRGSEVCKLIESAIDLNEQGRCLRPSHLRLMADGRAVEVGVDGRGCPMFAIFPSLEAARSYERPLSENEFYDAV